MDVALREENFIAGPSRIEIIGLQRGYKAPRAIMARVAHGRTEAENLIMAEETTKQRHASGESAGKERAHLPSA
jgi:hypothetical protein